MKIKYKAICLILIAIITLSWKNNIFHTTFAYSYDLEQSTLFYEEDNTKLENKIKIYLENIDDLLIANSSFEFSDILVYNYDFLIHFALDYILTHQESYFDQIEILENYQYLTKEGNTKTTNQYINLEEVYNITEQYFGIRDFEIINNDVQVINHKISLTNYTESKFPLKIKKIVVTSNKDQVFAQVDYEMNTKYLYTFDNQNNILKIKNVEVLS